MCVYYPPEGRRGQYQGLTGEGLYGGLLPTGSEERAVLRVDR